MSSAQFYRFGGIYEGNTLKRWRATSGPMTAIRSKLSRLLAMARIPPGGYPAAVTSTFDGLFTSVLANLEAAWMEGGPVGQSFDRTASA